MPCTEAYKEHIIYTHPDGHNHSGNIHVHIVINSLRIEKVPLLPYMERPANTREGGCKHRCTDALTPTLLQEFVEKIVIHESEALDGKRRGKLRRQEIEIYYSFVGKVELPDA